MTIYMYTRIGLQALQLAIFLFAGGFISWSIPSTLSFDISAWRILLPIICLDVAVAALIFLDLCTNGPGWVWSRPPFINLEVPTEDLQNNLAGVISSRKAKDPKDKAFGV
jgi:hypothetical protein